MILTLYRFNVSYITIITDIRIAINKVPAIHIGIGKMVVAVS